MKKYQKSVREGHPVTYLTNNLQNCQGFQKQEKSKKLLQPRRKDKEK